MKLPRLFLFALTATISHLFAATARFASEVATFAFTLVSEAFPTHLAAELRGELPSGDAAYTRDSRSRAAAFTSRRDQRQTQRRAHVSGSGSVGLGLALA